MNNQFEKVKKRFEEKIDKSKDCWIWRGTCNSKGYGNFTFNKQYMGSHRGAYMFFIGKIPVEMCVLHKCDNRKCVNPEHLFLGTRRDNARDAIAKGRFVFNFPKHAMAHYARSCI